MWHIVLIGYVFTTMMFALAQEGIARKLIYLCVFTIFPVVFSLWVMMVRHRNRMMKREEQQAFIQQQKQLSEHQDHLE